MTTVDVVSPHGSKVFVSFVMADQGKKKKNKQKGKTVSLNEFLSADGSTPPMPMRTTSWADESNELEEKDISTAWTDTQKSKHPVDMTSLPSAPRAVTTPVIDLARLPKNPPFTVFIGNLSYEASEEDIERHFNKSHLSVKSVRLVKDKDGRLKGFGYVEFDTQAILIEALELRGTMLKNRQLQVDVAEGRGGDGGMQDDRQYRGGSRYSDMDRTTGDWRNNRDPSPPPPPRGYRSHSPGRDYPDSRGYGGGGYRDRRDDRYQSRDRYEGSYQRRNYSPPPSRGSPPSYSRGGDRRWEDKRQSSSPSPRDTSPPPPSRDEGVSSEREETKPQGRGWDHPPRDSHYNGGESRRYDGGRREDGRYEDRRHDSRPPRRDGGGYDRGYGRGGYDQGGYNRGDRRDFQDRGDRRDYQDRGDRRDYQDRGDRRDYPRRDYQDRQEFDDSRRDRPYGGNRGRSPPQRSTSPEEVPRERKKLQLQPRSKPVDSSSEQTSSSIFGGAKPVDTTKKEKEIEEKLKRKEVEVMQRSGRKDSECSDGSKEPPSKGRLPSDGDDPTRGRGDRRGRKGSNRDDDYRGDDGEKGKGRGKRGGDYHHKPRDDDSRREPGRGRGRGKRGNPPSTTEGSKPPVILKKPDDQKPVDFEQKNRFAGLDVDENGSDTENNN